MARPSINGLRMLLLAGCASLAISPGAALAQGRGAVSYNIPAQDLGTALTQFGQQSEREIVFSADLTRNRKAPSVSGQLTTDEALAILLADSGLSYRTTPGGSIIVQAEGGSPQGESAAGGGAEVEALVVTAQKKEEAIQDVPIAISAFTQKSLDAQKLEGGFDLLKAIPNVTFSKNNFTGYNFSIRGIGTKAISATTDPGVSVSFNNSGLIVNRLFEQEYFDVERVEVLRGPQGTLYGRNATSGVINVISAKPRMGEFDADIKAETGNYNAMRLRGMVNIPITDGLALRAAGAWTKRDGYGLNIANGEDVDGRDLFSTRLTLGFEPNETLRVNALWEHFSEDDNRVRTSKQLCHHDAGPTEVGGVTLPATLTFRGRTWNLRQQLSQGCKPGSLYDEAAFGTPLGASMPFVNVLLPDLDIDVAAGEDIYASRTQSRNLREIESLIEPHYRAKADIFDLSIDFDVTDTLTFTSQTVYTRDEVYSTQDLNRFHTAPIFFDSTAQPTRFNWNVSGLFNAYYSQLTPGGVYCDPQLGCSDRMVGQDISRSDSTQFNQEFRLQSSFDGPINFSLGANYTNFETLNDYFVFINLLSYLAESSGVFNAPSTAAVCARDNRRCIYVDPNPLESIDGDGHNYFRSKNPYSLTSRAVFGEVYWEVTPTVKVTAGARMTWDRKDFTPVPSQTLLWDYREATGLLPPGAPPEACTFRQEAACILAGTGVGGRGYPAEPDIVQEWAEPTGRIIVDWKPDLGFTDETMVYASLAHGYKGGGMNPPSVAMPQRMFNEVGRTALAPPTFEPEFIDAYELGSKNTLMGGALIMNGSVFHYDYKDYQVSKIIDRTANNENFDAKISGAELEWVFSPTRNLRFNGAFGHLKTEIAEGEQSIDLMDRTQGNPDWVLIKPSLTQTSNCIAPADLVGQTIAAGYADLTIFCPGGNLFEGGTTAPPSTGRSDSLYDLFVQFGLVDRYYDPTTDGPNAGAGFFADLSGNELPNAPHWTASLGAQYSFDVPGGWEGTFRTDFYWQSQSYARVYNTQYDKLRAWTNTNVSLWFENEDWGVTAEVYVKNAFDETPITDAFLFSDDTGLTTNVFTLDPRLIGVSVRKNF